MGLNVLSFEDVCLREGVSLSLLGTAEPEWSPANLTPFCRLWKQAAPATGQWRWRDSRPTGPRSILRREELIAGEISRVRPSRKRPAGQSKRGFTLL